MKIAGTAGLLSGLDPANRGYAVVGFGAVVYSPAKYGILPLLTKGETELLKANSGLESYTIIAILAGSMAGGYLADLSISLALAASILIYGLSSGFNLLIPKKPGDLSVGYRHVIRDFWIDLAFLFKNPQSRYSLFGTGSFWFALVVLRMVIFIWLPLTLGITSGTSISRL